jgi:hypothetical protein
VSGTRLEGSATLGPYDVWVLAEDDASGGEQR